MGGGNRYGIENREVGVGSVISGRRSIPIKDAKLGQVWLPNSKVTLGAEAGAAMAHIFSSGAQMAVSPRCASEILLLTRCLKLESYFYIRLAE